MATRPLVALQAVEDRIHVRQQAEAVRLHARQARQAAEDVRVRAGYLASLARRAVDRIREAATPDHLLPANRRFLLHPRPPAELRRRGE